jgi:hypothetical protein
VGTCRADDLRNPEVSALATNADGVVVGEDGKGTFMAELAEGDISGVPEEFVSFSGAQMGLMDARKAEVHLVARTHGAASDDPAVLIEQLTKLNGGCNPECKNVQGAIHEPPNPDVTVKPVFRLIETGDMVGDDIQGTWSRITRDDERVIARVDTAELEPGAYTLWWVIFNHPEFCAGECRADDLRDPAVGALATYAAGAVVGEDGKATFMAELAEGDISGVPTEFASLPGASMGLMDARQAAVHLIVRSHGAASDDPVVLQSQITTLNGGCNPVCKNVQGAIHDPLRPIVLGDANGDGQFDEADLIAVFQAGKYGTGERASFSEGDWDGDGKFDTSDLVAVFKTGRYRNPMNATPVRSVFADELLRDKSAMRDIFEPLPLNNLL